MKTKLIIVFVVFYQLSISILSSKAILKIEDSFLDFNSLPLTEIDSSFSYEESLVKRRKNTRSIINYLESFFMEKYLQETGNKVQEKEVEERIDKLLFLTYGTAENPSKKYKEQLEKMAEIAPLLEVYGEDPEKAEKLYNEDYKNVISAVDWTQLKSGFSPEGFEQTKIFINAKIPTDEEIREGYRSQAYAYLLNQKFLEVLSLTGVNYSDWRNERFSGVEVLDANHFEVEMLTALFGHNKSSLDQVNIKNTNSIQDDNIEEIKNLSPTLYPEPNEGPIEQLSSPNRLPWLIGILILLIAIGIILKTRKSGH